MNMERRTHNLLVAAKKPHLDGRKYRTLEIGMISMSMGLNFTIQNDINFICVMFLRVGESAMKIGIG